MFLCPYEGFRDESLERISTPSEPEEMAVKGFVEFTARFGDRDAIKAWNDYWKYV